MTLATVLFTAQLTLRTLAVAHACLHTYKKVKKVYRWVAPPASSLWNSFVFVEVVPSEDLADNDEWVKL